MPEPLNTEKDTSLNDLFENFKFKTVLITGKKKKEKKTAADLSQKMLVNTANLMELLDCGKHTAIAIGHSANACVRLDRKLFWNVRLIQKYIDSISE
ncbi:hypothetical protein [Schaedlerella arabinosiphila]|uniref:hypothetical protein n=1 Tax=Schaedlerella arabinosiphila TaxID=2044587 RepID=UPI0025581778|nr:hypothetical protein [Schaedlerella arabinosiphila]